MTWDVVSHWNRPLHRWAGSSAICEKIARLLKLDFRLPLHVAKELDWRSRTMLSAGTKERDRQSAEQHKPDQEILNHARKGTTRPSRQFLPRTRGSPYPGSGEP